MKQFGITIVIITHQMSVIREICNRVAIIERWRIGRKWIGRGYFQSSEVQERLEELILKDLTGDWYSQRTEGTAAAQMDRIQGDRKVAYCIFRDTQLLNR